MILADRMISLMLTCTFVFSVILYFEEEIRLIIISEKCKKRMLRKEKSSK